jgi:peptidoglycan/xylan/chitin deacetylase (PgdA/CDA1 family)
MYHRVDPGKTDADPCLVSDSAFAQHLKALREAEYSGWTVDKLLHMRSGNSGAIKAAAITFDDGYADNHAFARPQLVQAGVKATFFIITGKIGQPGFMDWNQLRELRSNGMSVQSHTVSHLPLETLSRESVKRELQQSKATLEDGLGFPVDYVSFPHGSYSQIVLKAVAETGYSAAFSSNFGYFTPGSDIYRLPRLTVRKTYGSSEFSKLLRADHRFTGKARFTASVRRAASSMLGIGRYQAIYDAFYGRGKGVQ